MTPTQPQEDTARIQRDELLRLLNVTSPVGYQAITARTRLDEIAAELARAPVVAPERPADPGSGAKRSDPRPCSQVAAMLPAVERPRSARPTMAPPLQRARTAPPVRSLAVPATTTSTVAAVRERLDCGEDLAAAPWLSARVAQHLTAEEVAMLPPHVQLRLPQVTGWNAPPRIELAPVPGLPCIELPPVPERARSRVTEPVGSAAVSEPGVVRLALGLAVVLLGSCAVYALL